MSYTYVKNEGTITIDENGPVATSGAPIDIRGANDLMIIVAPGSDPFNSYYGDKPNFHTDADPDLAFDADGFTMEAGEKHKETPLECFYWWPVCAAGKTATVRFKAVHSREGV